MFAMTATFLRSKEVLHNVREGQRGLKRFWKNPQKPSFRGVFFAEESLFCRVAIEEGFFASLGMTVP
jgi:hypothetical protein